MTRFAIPLVLLYLLWCGSAAAQVATTDLVPAAPRLLHPTATGFNSANFTPDNPAALAWGMPSRIGGGILQGELSDNINPAQSFDYDGRFFGLRLVGEAFGFAVAHQAVEDDAGLGLTVDESSDAQLSLKLGDVLALGVGVGAIESETSQAEMDRISAGASLRLGEIFYLGAGLHRDDAEFVGVTQTVERDVTMVGVAMRTEGDWNWYLAYDVVDLDDFEFPGGGPGRGFKVSTATVQVLAGSLLIGASLSDVEASGTTDDISSRTIDFGWAPMEGLTLTARHLRTESEQAGVTEETAETTSVAVAWLF
ncbi:MAG: hypothetical protein V3T00_06355 [bacterium]